MNERFWDILVEACHSLFVPLICAYYAISGNFFLNSAALDANGLERAGDLLLAPFQYLCCGEIAIPRREGKWVYEQRFDYHEYFWVKTTAAIVAAPAGMILGSAIKALSQLSPECKKRMQERKAFYFAINGAPHIGEYQALGLVMEEGGKVVPQGYIRRAGDENHLASEKEALKEIGELLTKAGIPWWLDCGSCLGAYRYGGVIPWDEDIDIAVLLPDFDNVRRALLQLDPQKYLVQDWSGRLNPHNYFKVFVRETGKLIDIYHFAIYPETKTICYIFSLETSSLFPEWWKIRERRFVVSAPFDMVFPLKKAMFDGIEVFVPNETEKYLQRYYGINLNPAKVYDPVTNRYEKALDHPYWQRVYAH